MNSPAVAAAIVAGGHARRLGGVTKSTLVLECASPGVRPGGVGASLALEDAAPGSGGPARIIDWQLAELRQVADPIFIVAPDPARFVSIALAVIPDLLPGLGALGGIYTAIVSSPCERTLVVAGDMPFLPGALLRRLVRASAADIVVPVSARGYEPLCAVYSRRCAEPIRRRLDAGLLRASEMPEGVQVEAIGPESLAAYDPGGLLFINVNTPHDYERARGLVGSLPHRRGDRITD